MISEQIQKVGASLEKTNKRVRISTKRFIICMLIPGILFIAIFTYYPMIKGTVMAFQSYQLWDISKIEFIGFENFKTVFKDPYFKDTILNTIIWIVVSLFFQFNLGFALALLLKKKFKGSGIYQGLIFFPWAISGFMIGLIWRWLFNGQIGVVNDILMRIGIITTPIGFLSTPGLSLASAIVANIWYGIPFFAIMITAALESVPLDLYEAADIDGASSFYKFFKVTIPYIKPVLILTTLLRAIWILNFPDLIYSLTNGGPAGSSHILTTYMLSLLMFDQDYGKASAVGVIIMAVLISFTIFYMYITKFEESGDF